MDNSRTLHVEVSSTEHETVAQTEGDTGAAAETETTSIQFGKSALPASSLDKLTRLLSKRNLWLLNLIRKEEPQSVAELARLSGRPKASLTLTLRRLEGFGIIVFREIRGRRKVPVVVCDKLMLEVALDPAPETSRSLPDGATV